MPPLLSYIKRQFRHLGESSSQLTRWVIGRDGLASYALRAIRSPILSRTFDYIQRKSNFRPPVWQQTLDLPWYRRNRRWRRHSAQTTGNIADRDLNVNPQPDETYLLTKTNTYPSINNNLLSPPLMKDERTTAGNISSVSRAITLPPGIKKMPEKNYKKQPAQPLSVTTKEPLVRMTDLTYPAVKKDLFSQLGLTHKITSTTGKRTQPTSSTNEPDGPAQAPTLTVNTEQIITGIQNLSSNQVVSPHAEHSDIPAGVQQPFEIREPDHQQARDIKETRAEVNRHTRYTGPRQRLLQALKPATQRMTTDYKAAEAYPEASDDNLIKASTSPRRYAYDTKLTETGKEVTSLIARQTAFPFIPHIHKIAASRKPTLSTIHGIPALASLKRRTMIIPKSPRSTSPTLGEVTATEGVQERPRRLVNKILPQSTLQAGTGWNQRTSLSSSVQRKGQKADAPYEALAMADMSQILNRLHPAISEDSSINQDFVEGHPKELFYYRQSPSTDIPPVQPLVDTENIHDTMTLLSKQLFKSETPAPLSDIGKKYRFLRSREYIPSTADFNYGNQPASEMPFTFPIHRKAEHSIADGDNLLADISENINESTYSRRQHTPELSLAPVRGYTPAMTSSQNARADIPESRTIEAEENTTKPDINLIAEDVYRILKRRLSVERERKLGVF